MEDYTANASFTSVLVKDGFLYTQVNNDAIQPGIANLYANTYAYYKIDLTNPAGGVKITGIPDCTFSPFNAVSVTNDDIYFVVIGPDNNAFYKLNEDGCSASEIFSVSEGGFLQGLTVIEN